VRVVATNPTNRMAIPPVKSSKRYQMVEKKERLLELSFYIASFLVAAFYVYRRGQDRNWDLLNYHFYQGYSLLNGRFVVDIAAAGLQSFFNPIPNILAYFSLTHLPFPLSAWIILLIQLTCIPAIVLLAKEIGNQLGYERKFIPAIPAVVLGLLAPLWGSELGTTFFSSSTAPLILWGVYFIFISAPEVSTFSKARIATAGLLFGLAVGLKLTNAPFVVAAFLMMAVLIHRASWRALVLASAYFLTTCGLGFSFTAWWNWHLWSTWGSPVFPLYNAIFKSEFYDFANFRDMRWHFSSLQDFLTFILLSAWGTSKTSEIPFTDARYMFVTLLAPAAILCRPSMKLNRLLMAFIVFMASSFLLWVFMFAYQRYLIPFELLLGLLVWVLVVRIVESGWLRVSLMVGLTVSVALLMKTPDWGHAPMPLGEKNPFAVEMDAKLSATPGRYIVVGKPISYILPSLHPDSLFYGVGMSKQIDDLVFRRLSEPSDLPLRILSKDADTFLMPNILKRVGYSSLDCNYFRTGIGRYIICDVHFEQHKSFGYDSAVDADFSADGYFTFGGVLWEQGLSTMEQWGRWSDGGKVEFGLAGCLPQGRLKIIMTGHAFGPNSGLPVKVVVGDEEITVKFSDADSQQAAQFINDATCINKIIIKIPSPTSPHELGLSGDTRKLGLGLVSLKVIKE
jgi:hypothetical protein